MKKIVTVTFNPAIDKSTTVAELIPEKKLSCSTPVYQPGGGGINVARASSRLGGDVTAVYLAGGYTGNYFNELLEKEGIKCMVTQTKAETRENMVVFEARSGQQYRFGMPGPQISVSEWQQCLASIGAIAEMDYLVVSGSLPKGIPADIFEQLARIAKHRSAALIVDTSGEALSKAVETGVYLIKPNLRELSALSGKELSSEQEITAAAEALVKSGNCQVVVVSLGARGAILVTGRETLKIIPPAVTVKSTVGAGDSMVAGIVTFLAKGEGIAEAFRYGLASGTAATLNPGTELCHLSDVVSLYKQLQP
jgi:6-phosphofructokinase 2